MASDATDAMAVENEMFAAWAVSDMDLQLAPQNTLSDTIPIPIWAVKGVISNLAVDLAVTFNALVTNNLAQKAEDGRNLIARTLINNRLEGSDMSHMPLGEGRYRHNILTDTFDA